MSTLGTVLSHPFVPEKYILALELIVSMVLWFPPSWAALHPADTVDVNVIGSRVTCHTRLCLHVRVHRRKFLCLYSDCLFWSALHGMDGSESKGDSRTFFSVPL